MQFHGLKIEYIVGASLAHFLLGFAVAGCAYYLILTILLRGRSVLKLDESSIQLISVSLAVSFAVLSHILEDYFLKKF